GIRFSAFGDYRKPNTVFSTTKRMAKAQIIF
ncbi:MAG: hypothetical protein ACI8VT_001755, partial [Saprospiraceae bacterium]